MDEYRTLRETAQDEFTEKRSRFIGYVRPVISEREALDFISEIKSKHWDAKHNVYAYCLREGNVCRYSDDGEPSGTAGMPAAGIVTMRMSLLCRLRCDYSQYGRLATLIPECGGSISDTSFGESVDIAFAMTREQLAGFDKKLADATSGSIETEVKNEKYFEIN